MQLISKPPRPLGLLLDRQRLHYLLVGIGVLYAVYMLMTVPRWTVDDAYISFRYAYNLVTHGELNWNVGYDPVEGYTGVMLPLLVAPVIALGGDPAVASQAIGLLAFIASAVLLWRISGNLELPPIVRGIVQVLFLIAPSFYTHVFAGLETMLYMALILASFYALLLRADTLLPIVLLLASLTRPEGVLLAALFCGVRLIRSWREDRRIGRLLARFALLYVLPGSLYFLWRWSYYGYLLPNTFYVKVNGDQFGLTGLVWVVAYVLFPLFAALLTVPTLARIRPYRLEFAAVLMFVLPLVLLYSRSTLIMNYGYRFYMPFYPLCLVMLGAVVGFEHRRPRLLALALLPLAAQCAWCFTTLASAERAWIVDYENVLMHEHVPTAVYLSQHVPSNEWVILNDTGIMPYVTKLKTIDSGALNDEFIAHVHDPQAVQKYLRSFHAAAITIPWFEGSDEKGLDPYSLVPEPGDYQLITDYKDPQWVAQHKGFRVYLFLRKDLIK